MPKKKHNMGFEGIKVSLAKNGYVVHPKGKQSDEMYVFASIPELVNWFEKERSPLGEEREFLEKL